MIDSTFCGESMAKVKLPEGYGCEPLNSPQRFEAECPICLQVIRGVCSVSCCGQYFCRECIEYVCRERKRCPLCNNEDFSVRDDIVKQESLGGMRFRCSHRLSGCEWTGALQSYVAHLNEDATPSKVLSGCDYVKLPCGDCGEVFDRFCLPSHREFCPKRPYTCPYCRNWSATYQEVVDEHWPDCELCPVACPNECGAKPSRRIVQEHIRELCPLTVTLRNSSTEDKPGTSATGLGSATPASEKLKYFSRRVDTGKPWLSKPFHSHQRGYQMCISAVVKSSGMSVAAHVMQGKFDDHLRWPFRGVVAIIIVDSSFRENIELEIQYDANTPLSATERVFGGGERGVGWGCEEPISLRKLSPRYLLRDSPQYVKDDSLWFIVRVTISI